MRSTARRPPRGPDHVAPAVLVGMATAVVSWWRLGPVTRGTVWAEDGGLFLRERDSLGPVASLLHPYAGYLHLVPRLLVDLGRALPVEDYALVLSGGACAVVGVLAAVVFVSSGSAVRSAPVRVLVAATPALLPLAPTEISGNAANLHWFMLAAAPWVFARRARSWSGAVALAVLTALVVLTEPQTVLFLPLLVLAWYPLRDGSAARAWPRALPQTVVALLGCGAQASTALVGGRSVHAGTPTVADVVAGWLLQPFAGTWDPRVGAVARFVVEHGRAPVLLPAAVVAAVVVAGAVLGGARARCMTVALLVGSGVVWSAAVVVNGTVTPAWAHPDAALAAVPPLRYAAASGILLLSAVLVAAGGLLRPARRRVGRHSVLAGRTGGRAGGPVRAVATAAGWTVVALVVVVTAGHVVPGPTRRSDGPEWAAQVPAAVVACAAGRSPVVEVRTVPWAAQVSCSWLLGQ